MNRFKLLAPALLILGLGHLNAAPFEPSFADYPFPGTQFTVDAAANVFFAATYGITVSNAYLYRDSRDTVDGIGVSTGTTSTFGTTQTARIDFLDTTNFVSVDFWTINPTTYNTLDSNGDVIETFSRMGNLEGTYLFSSSTRISALTWTSGTGLGQVTGLRYDYDGKTDGNNDDLDPVNSVPDAGSTALLVGLGIAGLMAARRRMA